MSYKPEYNPNDPSWWLREPGYKMPAILPTTEFIDEIQEFVDRLRTNEAMLSRTAIEHYIAIKDDPEKLRKFLMLLIDMEGDGSLHAHLPKEEDGECEDGACGPPPLTEEE